MKINSVMANNAVNMYNKQKQHTKIEMGSKQLKDKVEISKTTVSKLKEEMAALSEVDNIDYRLQGRLIYISLKMASGVSKDTAKEIAIKTLDYFTEDEKKYYDIQIIITTSDENAEYPIIGYKHKTSTEFVW